MDVWLRDNRDFDRFENREIQACTIEPCSDPLRLKEEDILIVKQVNVLLYWINIYSLSFLFK